MKLQINTCLHNKYIGLLYRSHINMFGLHIIICFAVMLRVGDERNFSAGPQENCVAQSKQMG